MTHWNWRREKANLQQPLDGRLELGDVSPLLGAMRPVAAGHRTDMPAACNLAGYIVLVQGGSGC
ncbi:MAG: hypothetical protein M3256_12720 [Actinomycetota bacterium]|nr:hypothetical protein [Actinomycetota bacterium]